MPGRETLYLPRAPGAKALVIAATTIVVSGLMSAPAQAEVRMTVAGDPECIDESSVRRDLERLLGRALIDSAPTTFELDLQVERTQHGASVTARLSDGSGQSERQIEASTCEGLRSAIAVMLALALEPDGLQPAASQPADAPPHLSTEPYEEEGAERQRASEQAQGRPAALPTGPAVRSGNAGAASLVPATSSPCGAPTFHLLLRGLLDAGSGPGVLPGFRVGAGAVMCSFRFELVAGALASGRAPSPRVGARLDVALYSGSLGVSYVVRPADGFSLGPVLSFELGAMMGESSGLRVQNAGQSTAFWLAIRGGLFAELSLGPVFGIRLSGTLGTPLQRPQFQLVGLGTVFESDRLLFSLSFSLLAAFS